MHEHQARYGAPVRGARNGAPNGPEAHKDRALLGVVAGRPVYAIAGAAPVATEEEIVALRQAITEKENEAEAKRAAAHELSKGFRDKGVNPLTDTDAFNQIDEAFREGDELAAEADDLRERLEKVMERDSKSRDRRRPEDNRPGTRSDRPDAQALESIARRFTESPEYQEVRRLAGLQDGSAIDMDAVEILTREELLSQLRLRATLDLGTFVPSDRAFFPPIDIPVRRPRVLDMIFVGSTDSDTVEFIEETTRTDAAAETAYGTAVPEANYVYTKKTATVKRLGHFVTVTEGNVEDEGQIQTLIEGRLMNGVERRVETQVVSGNGTGENLRGILNTSGIGTQALGGDTRLDAIHKAITVVRINLEDEPDGIGLHPTDYQTIVLGKESGGAYLVGPPAQETAKALWGFPTAVTTAFPQGTGLVGRFKVGAVLWVRRGVSVKVTDAVNDDALKGLLKLIATMRAAFAAWVPKAFCQVTGL